MCGVNALRQHSVKATARSFKPAYNRTRRLRLSLSSVSDWSIGEAMKSRRTSQLWLLHTNSRDACTGAGHAGFAAHSTAFLAHKVAYAALLADYGRVQDATRYCASVQVMFQRLPTPCSGVAMRAALSEPSRHTDAAVHAAHWLMAGLFTPAKVNWRLDQLAVTIR